MKDITKFILYLLLFHLVLAIEQSYGLPIVAIALCLLFGVYLQRWWRVAWLISVGLILATVFKLPLGGGVLVTSLLFGAWLLSSRLTRYVLPRLLLVTFMGVLIFSLAVPFLVTPTMIGWALISTLIVVVMTKFIFLVSEAGGDNQYVQVKLKL